MKQWMLVAATLAVAALVAAPAAACDYGQQLLLNQAQCDGLSLQLRSQQQYASHQPVLRLQLEQQRHYDQVAALRLTTRRQPLSRGLFLRVQPQRRSVGELRLQLRGQGGYAAPQLQLRLK